MFHSFFTEKIRDLILVTVYREDIAASPLAPFLDLLRPLKPLIPEPIDMRSQDEMTAFVKVVELASFTAAAEHLQVPKSTLSRWISRLEERLGAQLITRTTRSIYLTELGQAYYSRCRQIISRSKKPKNPSAR